MAHRLASLAATFAAFLLASFASGGFAQKIATDGTLGAKTTLAGPNYAITPDLGKQVGGNLFHSFRTFGLDKGDSAVFSGPATVNNVISRVTGGSSSSIDGKIDSSAIPGANFYLINPSGIVFGPNAAVNVAGSFHAASADYIKLSDGAKFSATNAGDSTLTAAPPAAFGFLTATPPALTVNGSQLSVPAGQTLGLVGGPGVTIGSDAASGSKAALTAPAGTIHITSVAGTGEVSVNLANAAGVTVKNFGAARITGGATLDVSDPSGHGSGGSVYIRAGALTVDASEINGDNYGDASGGQISLVADGSIAVTGGSNIHAIAQSAGAGAAAALTTAAGGSVLVDNSTVKTGSAAAGNSGSLAVTTGSFTMQNAGQIGSTNSASGIGGTLTVNADGVAIQDPNSGILSKADTGSSGDAGDITVTAGTVQITASGGIASPTFGAGNGGNISINASGALTLDGTLATPGFLTAIVSTTVPGSSGNSGNITVNAGTLKLINGSEIVAGAFSSGRAGDVSFRVDGALTIDGSAGPPIFTGILVGSSGLGNAGNVRGSAGTISLSNGGLVFSGTFGPGKGGDISLSVTDALSISGRSRDPAISTGLFSGPLPGSTGNAGSIVVNAGSLNITDQGNIFSGTFGFGNAAPITVNTPGAISIDGTHASPTVGTGIFSGSLPGARGNGADVSVRAGSLSITNGGSIGAGTFSSGNGGDVMVDVAGAAKIQGNDVALSFTPFTGQALTGISTDAVLTNLSPQSIPILTGVLTAAFPGATGNAGNVSINASSLDISHNGLVFSPTFGPGNGGDVTLNIGGPVTVTGTSQSGLLAETAGLRGATGNAGNITINAGSISLIDNGVISSHALLANGGSIDISVGDLLYLRQSRITTQVDASTGNGGNITIVAPRVVLDRSAITADAFGSGANGNIDINADAFVESVGSSVRATGVVTFSNPPTNLTGALVVLPSELRGAAQVLRDSCAARSALPRSSLTDVGRGGLAQDPAGTIPALYFAERNVDAALASAPAPAGAVAPASETTTQASSLYLTMRCGL